MTDKPLDGKVAVVTGAGRGIGRAIAIAYGREGAAVCCAARSAPEIAETAAIIAEEKGQAIAETADVRRYAEVAALFDKVASRFGGIDIVVVNAGVSVEDRLVVDSDPDSWRQTLEVNLIGAYHTAKAAISHLRRNGGKLIFIGSGMGHRGAPTRSAYCISKAGVWMLTRVLSEELREHGIAVNELVPGPVRTGFVRGRERALQRQIGGDEWLKEPEDVVPMALFLATQPANGPTGQSFSLARRQL